nr:uncharacterized protein LOC127347052 [Lolium perenne]
MARGPDAIPPMPKEQGAAEGSGPSVKMRERRTKAVRDSARPSDPDAPAEETPSTEAVVQGDETHESRRPPLSTLSFTELHAALSEVHVAEVKRQTALVEEAAKKNRQLVAIGTEAREKALAEAREGYVKESFYREADLRAKDAEAATKSSKVEVVDLSKVLEDKSKELEDVIAEYKGKLESATEARDAARGATGRDRGREAAARQGPCRGEGGVGGHCPGGAG